VYCKERDGVVTHLVESIEEAPFLNRSVEAFFDEGLKIMRCIVSNEVRYSSTLRFLAKNRKVCSFNEIKEYVL
jgi:hypothetical protein